jgi:hypothetical protein
MVEKHFPSIYWDFLFLEKYFKCVLRVTTYVFMHELRELKMVCMIHKIKSSDFRHSIKQASYP